MFLSSRACRRKQTFMNLSKLCLCGVMGATLSALLWACGSSGNSNSPAADSLMTRTGVAQYRQWNRVNPQPVLMAPAFAALCAGTPPNLSPDPHKGKYATVYVNDVGKSAMLTQQTPHYPIGTVIVKEKSATPDAKHIDLLTVMIKRESGIRHQKRRLGVRRRGWRRSTCSD